MSEKRAIKILLDNGAIQTVEIEIADTPPWSLKLLNFDSKTLEFVGADLFDALAMLRQEIEKSGGRLLCAGARPEVRPSGMSRSMGGGRKAYVIRIGEPSRKADIDIFDYADPEAVGSVAEQAAFYEKWVKSLRE